jgi:hypothetical protein
LDAILVRSQAPFSGGKTRKKEKKLREERVRESEVGEKA